MNANRLSISLMLVITLLLSACASAATPSHELDNRGRDGGTNRPAEIAEATRPVAENYTAYPTAAAVATEAPLVMAPESPNNPVPLAEAEKSADQPRYLPSPSPLPTQAVGEPPTPAANEFDDYGVNPFVDTVEDHLSTFAIDVDTASYSVARNYINNGGLPPADAVRVEEFVNYFDQGYTPPENLAFALYADGAPSPFHNDGTILLRFGVQGYKIPEYARKPATLTFLIDVSGSMDMDNRLELVKQTLNLLVDRLRSDDVISIVAYSDTAWVVLEPVTGDSRGTILDAIYSLHPMNSTNAEAGIRLAYQTAMQAFRANTTNRVILCSDGVANVGNTDPEIILSEVRGYVGEGITLTSVGVGMGNFNDVLLEQLADNGDGNYAYVDTLDEARKVLVDDLVSTLEVIAYDAKIQVDFNPDVVARYRLLGYENRAVADSDFRNDSVDAGEIGAGHNVTAIYAVQLKQNAEGRIGTMQLRWQDAQSRQVQELNGNFNTWDLAARFEDTAARYQLAVTVAEFAEILRGSPWAASMSLGQFYAHAYAVYQKLPGDTAVVEFAELVYKASQIQR
ncbi:MAG: YfbK domain-containing protein [Chloroflexota bacterium]